MTEQVTIYVGTMESGEYDDYRMHIHGVFASLEDAQAAFSQDSVETEGWDPEFDDASYQEWSTWEVNDLGVLWTQSLRGWGSTDRRTITKTFIGEVWDDE